MSHALIIGGTGMLRDVSLHLAATDDVVSVVARNCDRLQALVGEAAQDGHIIEPLALDYFETAKLAAAINDSIRRHGRIHCVICWIHSGGDLAREAVVRSVGRSRFPARVFDIRGSAAANPLDDSHQRKLHWESKANIIYREVILGYVIEANRSRWLSNEEIAAGVIEAIQLDKPSHLLGIVEPWSERPQA